MKKYVSAALVAAMIASMGVSAMADVSFGSGANADVAWPTDFGFGDKLTVISSNESVTEYAENQKISLKPGDTIYMPLTHTAMVEEAPEEAPETETPEVEAPETDNENTTPETPEVPETDNENGSEEENNGSTEETPEVPETDVEGDDSEETNPEEVTPVVIDETVTAEAVATTVPYGGKVDKDWKIRFSAGKFVNDATFYTATAEDENLVNGALYVKVEMDSFLDSVDKESISYNVYISESGTRNKSDKVSVKADFENVKGGTVSFDTINFVGEPSIWEVDTEHSGKATFDFDGEAFFDVTMYDDEVVLLGLSRDYVREIGIANEDAQLNFYNFLGSNDEFIRKGTLSIYGEEDSYVYEIVGNKLYDVDFSYNEDEETIEIHTDELGHYVVSDMELEAKEFKPSTDSDKNESNSDKNNPDTGADDFVGAAAALAVVSVAAAGALALKGKK